MILLLQYYIPPPSLCLVSTAQTFRIAPPGPRFSLSVHYRPYKILKGDMLGTEKYLTGSVLLCACSAVGQIMLVIFPGKPCIMSVSHPTTQNTRGRDNLNLTPQSRRNIVDLPTLSPPALLHFSLEVMVCINPTCAVLGKIIRRSSEQSEYRKRQERSYT